MLPGLISVGAFRAASCASAIRPQNRNTDARMCPIIPQRRLPRRRDAGGRRYRSRAEVLAGVGVLMRSACRNGYEILTYVSQPCLVQGGPISLSYWIMYWSVP